MPPFLEPLLCVCAGVGKGSGLGEHCEPSSSPWDAAGAAVTSWHCRELPSCCQGECVGLGRAELLLGADEPSSSSVHRAAAVGSNTGCEGQSSSK